MKWRGVEENNAFETACGTRNRAGELVTKDMEKAKVFNAFFSHSLLMKLVLKSPGALRARGRSGA